MLIKVLGPGCKNCTNLEKNVREALTRLGVDAEVEKVTEYADIMAHGVMSTPGLVIDGDVVSYGRVPTPTQIVELIQAR
ncbi:TM0996/MTH895 family glutaredoxin-like protein [Tessaracoccus sp. MC1627]|uniref:thioredoxin family protein n=1 Tax=Tessaracoccus sp. MC1627 TaxID=2760312 RepID=UPI0016047D5B|nr:thioredoxin family protein [Tessaracoccus sp. MC1627]MBB1511720.1 TM0996/MTH895 family glutaredoxin-like protein [Tessaracoccus sp. MC1627]